MANFCNKCTIELFGDDVKPDIDVYKEFHSLEPGSYTSGLLCEGCGLRAVAKTDLGILQVIRSTAINDNLKWENY